MQKLISVLFFTGVLLSSVVDAQNTISPFSMFGPGEIQNKGFGRSQAMGGAGISLKSDNHLNNINPASYAWMDSLRIIAELGVQGKFYNLGSANKSQTGFNANLNYLAMGFKYNNWLAGSFGLVPFSTVGYTVESTASVEGTSEKYTSVYKGNGGISQVYFSNAVKIGEHFSAGVNVSYLFGPLTQEENIAATDIVPQLQIVRQDFMKSFYFDYGIQYSQKFKKSELSLGAVFSNRQNLKSMHILSVYNESYALIRSETFDTDYLIMPLNYGVGAGFKRGNRLHVLFDYNFQQWSQADYPTQKDEFQDLHRFSLGSEFRPWQYSVTNKPFKNWVYRFGLNYQRSFLSFGNRVIEDKSVSFGAGIPMPGKISNFEWSVRYGQNGTKQGGLIREDYLLLQLGFSLNEFAFIRRKFD